MEECVVSTDRNGYEENSLGGQIVDQMEKVGWKKWKYMKKRKKMKISQVVL